MVFIVFLERWFSGKVRRATKGQKNGGRQIEERRRHVFGGHCGRRVRSQEPKGIPGGPLRAQGAAQERPRNLWHGLAYLFSITYFRSKKLSGGVMGGND